MNDLKNRTPLSRRWFVLSVSLLVLSLSLTGCTTLKKKFTRKKKGQDSEAVNFIPVLEPIDYAPKQQSAQERYFYHYTIWKGWYQDLIASLDDNLNDKRIKYLMTESITQLEEMSKWITGGQQEKLKSLIQNWVAIQKEFDRPAAMRNAATIKSKLASQEKNIRTQFGVKQKDALPYVK